MDLNNLEKANELLSVIKELRSMKNDFRPKHCNGVGVIRQTVKNPDKPFYQWNLWSTSNGNTDHKSLIMRVGILAMHNEVERLLDLYEQELIEL